MTQTVSARLPEKIDKQLREKCDELGCTVNDYLKEAIETRLVKTKSDEALSEPLNYEEVFEHMKECVNCNRVMINKGYILVSLEELKKHNLIPVRNPT
jgi:hypothetical protein